MNKPVRMSRSTVQWIGLGAAPLLAVLAYLLMPDGYVDVQGEMIPFAHAGKATVALAVWMAVWWMTEAIPVYATALLPLVMLPLLDASTMRRAAAPYGHELIFLFMGGFIIALAMQRWGLHWRIAYGVLQLVGERPRSIVAGFMFVTAGLSMWMSNTAVTIMMLPIALSVIDLVARSEAGAAGIARAGERKAVDTPFSGRADLHLRNFPLCLLLGIAYAASIGGIGTLIGTPPNLFLASFIRDELGQEISFVRWMGVGLPVVIVFLPIVWLLMTRVLYPLGSRPIEGGAKITRDAYARLGPMKPGEMATLIVFSLTAIAWLTRPLLVRIEFMGARPLEGLTDPGIAIGAALLLFVIPVDVRTRTFVMNWETAVKLPWGILILFGGGLSLAAAINTNGVAALLGSQVGAARGAPPWLLVLLVTALMIYLTEITSNTATTATMVPLLAALAPGLGLHAYMLIVPAAIAASCAFMLPVATPPNAIIFGSGHVTIPQMCRAGFWLNMIGIVLITVLTYAVALPLLGVTAR